MSRIIELGQMLKFYIFDKYSRNMRTQICYGLYTYIIVYYKHCGLYLLIRQASIGSVLQLVPAETSTIYGESNSSAYSLKAPETIRASWDSG